MIGIYALWGDWWSAGLSFSQRFFTGLFPLFVIGVAALAARFPVILAAAATGCVIWSLFIGVNHRYGYEGVGRNGLDHRPDRSPVHARPTQCSEFREGGHY